MIDDMEPANFISPQQAVWKLMAYADTAAAETLKKILKLQGL